MNTGGAGEPPGSDEVQSLERAIAALEQQRAALGDEVVDTALMSLSARRDALLSHGIEQRRLAPTWSDSPTCPSNWTRGHPKRHRRLLRPLAARDRRARRRGREIHR